MKEWLDSDKIMLRAMLIMLVVAIPAFIADRISAARFNSLAPWIEVSEGVYKNNRGEIHLLIIDDETNDPQRPKGIYQSWNWKICDNDPPQYFIRYVTKTQVAAGNRIWPIAKGQKRTNAEWVEVYGGKAYFLNDGPGPNDLSGD